MIRGVQHLLNLTDDHHRFEYRPPKGALATCCTGGRGCVQSCRQGAARRDLPVRGILPRVTHYHSIDRQHTTCLASISRPYFCPNHRKGDDARRASQRRRWPCLKDVIEILSFRRKTPGFLSRKSATNTINAIAVIGKLPEGVVVLICCLVN